jgi:hypothetical protein
MQEDVDVSNGYYIKEGVFTPPSQNAQRQDLAEELWALSCDLTGINWV